MGIKEKIFGKSKEQKEMERTIRYRKAKSKINKYISNLKELQNKVFEQGKEAASLNDKKFLKRQAKKYLTLQERIQRGKKLLMVMEEAQIQRELVKLSGNFVEFAQDVAESIGEGVEIEDIASTQKEMEKAMLKAESMDEALSTAVDMTSEGILTNEEFSGEKVEEMVDSMTGEAAEDEEIELDTEISDGLEEVEEEMKKDE